VITARANPPVRRPYAGIVTRAVAFVADLLVLNGALFGAALVVGLIIEAFGKFSPNFDLGGVLLAGATWTLAFIVYFTSSWSLTGQTPGMRALGIKVLSRDGELLRPRRGIARVVGMAIAAIPLFAGYLPILVRDRREGLHDLIARSVVVYVERERPVPASRRTQVPTSSAR
jgi:uncharacterized RDD family membrane protein YckC